MCLFLAELGLCRCMGFSPVGGSSLVAGFPLLWLLSLQSAGSRACGRGSVQHVGLVVAAPRLPSTGSVVLASGLRCSRACGLFPDQGSPQCVLPLGGGLVITEPPGKCILDVLSERRCLVLLNCRTCCADCHQAHDSAFSCTLALFLAESGHGTPQKLTASCVV